MSANEGAAGDSWTRTTLLALLLVVLGKLLLTSDGHYTPEAAAWLLVAALLGAVTVVAPPVRILEELGICVPSGVLLAGLAWQFTAVLTHPPGMYLRPASGWVGFIVPEAVGAVLAGSLAFAARGWARVGTALVTLCFLAAG
ncbi:MAG TPA: hypothetical protein VK454_12440, partial [Myxococcaceae bacterium]|nr:hypothetical protein [Myxococcaceae bacterium]